MNHRLLSRRLAGVILACALAAAAGTVAQAQVPQSETAKPADAPAAPRPWYEQISLNAFVSTSATGNFNSPASRTNQFRVFDTNTGSIQLDAAQLVVQREISGRGEVGFRTDVAVGTVASVTAAAGLFRDDTGEAGDFDILQAYLSYIAPAGRGLRFDVGKFTTHIGYEVVEGYEGYNDNHSHSFLFTYAEPVSHTGLRVSYPFTEKVSALVVLANGWDNVVDANTGKSIGAQIDVAFSPRTSIVLSYMGGPEQPGTNANIRHTIDAYAVRKLGGGLTLALDYGYGREEQVTIPESVGGGVRDASWQGVAGYGRYEFSSRFAATLRAEWFDDPQGARTGYAQTLNQITVTPEFRPHPKFVVRGDLRRDQSNRPVFELSDGTFGTSQVTLSVNALVVF